MDPVDTQRDLEIHIVSLHANETIPHADVSSSSHLVKRLNPGEFAVEVEGISAGILRVSASGFLPREITTEQLLTEAKGTGGVRVVLRALGNLRVLVTDEVGQAVPGASINVSRDRNFRASAAVGGEGPYKTSSRPEALGVCSIPNLPSNEPLWYSVYGPCLRKTGPVTVDPHGETQLDVVVVIGATLIGRLVDATGRGIAGVPVTLAQSPAEHQPVNKRTRTDDSGRFQLDSVVPGPGTLRTGGVVLALEVHPGLNELEPIRLDLRAVSVSLICALPVDYRNLRLEVRDALGQLLEVRFSTVPSLSMTLPSGELFLDLTYVRDEGGGYRRFLGRESIGADSEHLDVQLDTWLASLRVEGAGLPAGDEVQVQMFELPEGFDRDCFDAPPYRVMECVPPRLPGGGLEVVLPAGAYDCLVATDSGSQLFREVGLSRGKATTLTYENSQLGTLSGRVIGELGAGVRGVAIELNQAGRNRSTVSGDDGRFTFQGVQVGRFSVAISAQADGLYGSKSDCFLRAGAVQEVVLVGRTAGRVSGTVKGEDGVPMTGQVGLRRMLEGEPTRFAPLIDGEYRFAAVRSGLHLVSHGAEGRLVLVQDGESHEVDLTTARRTTATIEILDNRPVQDAVFVENGPDGGVTPISADRDGLFQVATGSGGGWLILYYGDALRSKEHCELVPVPGPGHHRRRLPSGSARVTSQGSVPPELWLVGLPGGGDVPLVGGTPRVRLRSGGQGTWEYGGVVVGAEYELRGLDSSGRWRDRSFTVTSEPDFAVDW